MGCPHPDFLLELLTHRQLLEWAQFLALEPRAEASDARHSTLLAFVARALGAKNLKPSDFSMALPDAEPVLEPDEREKYDRMVGIIDRAERAASRPRRKRK